MSRGYPKAAGNASAPEDGTQERFQTTQWSVVLVAGGTPSPGAETALADLLRTYWHPLYAYVRSRGYSPEDSQDLIQGFYERLLEGHRLGYADPKRGRFRTFLLTCLNHFLANEKDARQAIKRGGRIRFLPLSAADMEVRHKAASLEELTPEKAFDRHWAMALLEAVLTRLRQEQGADGQAEAFELLKPFLEGGQPAPHYVEVAARLGIAEGAARMKVLRLRRRYRTLILEQIAATLADPAETDEERRSLLAALRSDV